MPANTPRKLAAVILSLLMLSNFQLVYASCPAWSTKVVLSRYANGQPGLVAFNGKLFLTWGDKSTNELHSLTSTDGINWTDPQVLSSFPKVYSSVTYAAPPPYASGGVNMTASTSCGYVYVAYADPTGENVYGARSEDGITWDGGHKILSVSDLVTSSPALYGNDSTLPIGFAAPSYNGTGYQQGGGSAGGAWTYIYNMKVGRFNCDFGDPRLLSGSCFFPSPTNACQDMTVFGGALEYDEGVAWSYGNYTASGPWSPLWTGADGIELKALGRGNPLGNVSPGMWYSVNKSVVDSVASGTQWTNNGMGGAVNPANSAPYLVWSCREFDGDTCNGNPWINFYNVKTGYWCSESPNGDWSISMPAMTFFNGKLWVAWRGGWQSDNGAIMIASAYPF
jgi:hypothetical protein